MEEGPQMEAGNLTTENTESTEEMYGLVIYENLRIKSLFSLCALCVLCG
jgi:hypothetical protein